MSLSEAFTPLAHPATEGFMRQVYFVDRLHPSVLGHKLIAAAVAYNLLDHDIDQGAIGSGSGLVLDHDSGGGGAAADLPAPLAVSPGLAAAYESAFHRVSLTDAAAAAARILNQVPPVGTPGAFTVAEDVVRKPGLISNVAGASVTIELGPPPPQQLRRAYRERPVDRPATFGDHRPPPKFWSQSSPRAVMVVVGHLVSYEGMGAFDAEVVARLGPCANATPSTAAATASSTGAARTAAARPRPATAAATAAGANAPATTTRSVPSAFERLGSLRVDGLRPTRVSVYATSVLSAALPERMTASAATAAAATEGLAGPAEAGASPICVALRVTVASVPGRAASKVKLYDVSWAWTNEAPTHAGQSQ